MKTIQTKGGELVVVTLPNTSHGFNVSGRLLNYTDGIILTFAPLSVGLPDGNWELLGEVDNEGVMFDCDEYVESERSGEELWSVRSYYKNYHTGNVDLEEYRESFITLLESNGIYPRENEKLVVLLKK